MGAVLFIAIIIVLALLLLLVFAMLVSLGIGLIGWVLSLVFPLSAFEGAIIAIVATAGGGYVLYRLAMSLPFLSDWLDTEDLEDWEEEDEPEPPIVPWRAQRPTPAPPKRDPKGKRGRR